MKRCHTHRPAGPASCQPSSPGLPGACRTLCCKSPARLSRPRPDSPDKPPHGCPHRQSGLSSPVPRHPPPAPSASGAVPPKADNPRPRPQQTNCPLPQTNARQLRHAPSAHPPPAVAFPRQTGAPATIRQASARNRAAPAMPTQSLHRQSGHPAAKSG